jgi:MobA/VirD2-like, nuclease domain
MISAATRGSGGARLAEHLLKTSENERVVVRPGRGLATFTLREQIYELGLLSRHGRTSRPLYHVHADPAKEWREAEFAAWWADLEEALDLEEHPYAEVEHLKYGRRHRHRVYSLVKPDGRTANLSHDYAKRERAARLAELRTGEKLTKGRHNRAVINQLRSEGRNAEVAALQAAGLADGDRPTAQINSTERLQEARTGVVLTDLRQQVATIWDQFYGQPDALAEQLARHRLTLAAGDKPGHVVVVDRTGNVHDLARTLNAAKKAAGGGGPRLRPNDVLKALGQTRLQTIETIRQSLAAGGSPLEQEVAYAQQPGPAESAAKPARNVGDRGIGASVASPPTANADRSSSAAYSAPAAGRDERFGHVGESFILPTLDLVGLARGVIRSRIADKRASSDLGRALAGGDLQCRFDDLSARSDGIGVGGPQNANARGRRRRAASGVPTGDRAGESVARSSRAPGSGSRDDGQSSRAAPPKPASRHRAERADNLRRAGERLRRLAGDRSLEGDRGQGQRAPGGDRNRFGSPGSDRGEAGIRGADKAIERLIADASRAPHGYARAAALGALSAHVAVLERQVAAGMADEAAATREERASQAIRQRAAAASDSFRAALATAYLDPGAAEAAWKDLKRRYGAGRAGRFVEQRPALLGQLKGQLKFFGLFADRERRAAVAFARSSIHLAIASGRAWAAFFAEKPVHAATAVAARSKPNAIASREAAHALRRHRLSSVEVAARAADEQRRAEIEEIGMLADTAATVGPGGAVMSRIDYSWPADLPTEEVLRRRALFARHPQEASSAIVKAFQARAPDDYQRWLSRQPDLKASAQHASRRQSSPH